MIEGSQQTVTWHINDLLKSSHKKSKVNDNFADWLTKTHASDGIGKVKVVCGKQHDQLAVLLDCSEPGVVKVDVVDCTENTVEDFPEELNKHGAMHLWSETPFKVDENSPALDQHKKEEHLNFVCRVLFVMKHAQPDIQPAPASLAAHVKEPTEQDWFKLKKTMQFLKCAQSEV